MGQKSGNLVTHAFGRYDGHFIDDTFVDVKIKCQSVVIFFNDFTCGTFDGFSTDSSPAIHTMDTKQRVKQNDKKKEKEKKGKTTGTKKM